MYYEYNHSEYSLRLCQELKESGLDYPAFLASVKVRLDKKEPLYNVFLYEEVSRLQDLFGVLDSLQFIRSINKLGVREKNIVMPLLRASYEGMFRAIYIFGEKQFFNFKENEVKTKERFDRIVADYLDQYYRYTNNIDLDLDNIPSREIRKKLNFYDSISNVLKLLEIENHELFTKKFYKFYQYCSFSSHGNTNRGLMRAGGTYNFVKIDMVGWLNLISKIYLLILDSVFDCDTFFSDVRKGFKLKN